MRLYYYFCEQIIVVIFNYEYMRLIKTVVLLFFASVLTMAQDVSYEYFTKDWKKTSQRRAYFIREIKKLDNDLYFVCDSAINGRTMKRGYYKSLIPEVEHGNFTFVFKDRNEIYTGNYNNGEMTGMWHVFDLYWNKKHDVNYDFELTTIEVEIIDNLPAFIEYESPPMFEGGEVELLKYLANNVKYPARALLYGIRGRVFCQFIVDTTGQVVNIKILRNADKDLDKEALRVVAGSPPKWKPSKSQGKKGTVQYFV